MTPWGNFFLAFIIVGVIVYFSYKLRFLTVSGSLASLLIGTVVLGGGGLNWALILLWFFLSSNLLSQIDKEQKVLLNFVWEKGDKRDAVQVLANGSVASILVISHDISPGQIWYLLFVSTMAAVTADTWGTEIGVWSKSSVRSVLNFKKVPKGTSGGITLLGTIASLLGSLSVAVLGIVSPYAPYKVRLDSIFFITLAGFLASVADSFLGATVQSQYLCGICNRITERKLHCNQNASLNRGRRFINNDLVNFLCSLCGTGFGYFFTTVFF